MSSPQQYDPRNRFNIAEMATVNALSRRLMGLSDTAFRRIMSDPDLTDGIGGYAITNPADEGDPNGLIRTIHTKINRDEGQRPQYFEDEVPAIGVSSTGQPRETKVTFRRRGIEIGIVLDIVTYSSAAHLADRTAAQIASQVQSEIAWMIDQPKSSPDILDGYFLAADGKGPSGAGSIEADGVVGLSVQHGGDFWVGEAAASFTIVVQDEGY